jgi:c-di-GMP-binding flagellar brake protein YcgR/CheY-like chemotaxis protein
MAHKTPPHAQLKLAASFLAGACLGIKNFFKVKAEPFVEPALRDRDQVLAWFEDLMGNHTGLDLIFGGTEFTPVRGRVEDLDEEAGTVTLTLRRRPTVEPEPGQTVKILFTLEGQRFESPLIHRFRGGYMEYGFDLPPAVFHADRREAVRAKFDAFDHYSIVALQSLSEGIGLTGELVDLSLGGCAFRVQKARQVQSDIDVPVRPDFLQVGGKFALVRLPNLPDHPLVECTGRVSHIHPNETGEVMVGMTFENVGAAERVILDRCMQELAPNYYTEFPKRNRRRTFRKGDLRTPGPKPAPAVAAAAPVPLVPEVPEAIANALAFLDDLDLTGLDDDADPDGGPDSYRKRGKRILLAMTDDLERTLLTAELQRDGYTRVLEANGIVRAREVLRTSFPLDLVILDHTVGFLPAIDILGTLRSDGLPKTARILVLQRQPDMRLTVALKAGGIHGLAPYPAGFQEQIRGTLETLLGLD